MADPKKIEIEINTKATGNGAEQAARGLDQLGNASEKAKNNSKEHAQEVDSLGESISKLGSRTSPAREAFEGLERASNGGAGSIFALAKAIKGVMEIGAGASPFGILITSVSALVAIGLTVKEKFFTPVEEGLKKTSDEAQKTAEKLTKFEQIELNFDKQNKRLNELAGEFDLVRQKADAAYAAAQKLNDAKTDSKIAQINLREQEQLSGAGSNDELKKQISSKAEVDRTNTRANAELKKSQDDAKHASEDIASRDKEDTATRESVQNLAKTAAEAVKIVTDDKKSAAAAGIKSDQQTSLDELTKLRQDQKDSDKKGEKLRAKISAEIDTGTVGPDTYELGKQEEQRRKEQGTRDVRIAQLQNQAPEFQAQIAAGKETYSDVATRERERAKKLAEDYDKNPTDENQGARLAATARADAAERLAKDIPKAEDLVTKLPDIVRDAAKKIGANDVKRSGDQSDIESAQERQKSIETQRKADLVKVGNTVSDENRSIDTKNQKVVQDRAAAEVQSKQIDDQILKSEDLTERQKLQASQDALKGKGGANTVPLLNVDTSEKNESSATPQLRIPRRKGSGTITKPDGTVQEVKPFPKTGEGAKLSDDSSGAAEAIENGTQAISKAAESIKPIPHDALSAPVEQIKTALDQSNASTSAALNSLGTATSTIVAGQLVFAQQIKAVTQQVDNLTSRVAAIS